MLYLVGLVVVVAFALAFWRLFGAGNSRRARGSDLLELRQTENKVKVSDPILRRDIDILERYGSGLLQDAIELQRAQISQGDTPTTRPPYRRAITSCITMTTSGTPLELCAKIPPDDVTGLVRG